MKTPTARLPMRVSAQILLSHRLPGEPVIIMMIFGVGTTAPYEFRDDEGRDYVCRWETKIGGHVMRVPAHLWAANNHKMARSCMERRRQQYPVVVGIELAEVGEVASPVEFTERSVEPEGVAVGLGHAAAPSMASAVEPDFSVAVEPVMVGGETLTAVITAVVAEGPMRAKSVAAMIGGEITEDQVKAAAGAEGSGLSFKSGWISISE
jgi:hypothetical protein